TGFGSPGHRITNVIRWQGGFSQPAEPILPTAHRSPANPSTRDPQLMAATLLLEELDRDLTLDGTHYRLTVVARNQGMHAFWDCALCGTSGYCKPRHTAEEAFAAAEIEARVHQASNHASRSFKPR